MYRGRLFMGMICRVGLIAQVIAGSVPGKRPYWWLLVLAVQVDRDGQEWPAAAASEQSSRVALGSSSAPWGRGVTFEVRVGLAASEAASPGTSAYCSLFPQIFSSLVDVWACLKRMHGIFADHVAWSRLSVAVLAINAVDGCLTGEHGSLAVVNITQFREVSGDSRIRILAKPTFLMTAMTR